MKKPEIKILENQKVNVVYDIENELVIVQKEFADKIKSENLDYELFERLLRCGYNMFKIDQECALAYGEKYDAEVARETFVENTVGIWLEVEAEKMR